MNLEDRYKSSGKGKNISKSDLATKFTTDRSKLNIDAIPTKYNVNGKIASLGDTSRLNIDITPTKYHG